jgi:ribonucleoside-diphosphate reductase alpha chain
VIKEFKTSFANDIFKLKYAHGPNDTWNDLSSRVVDAITGGTNVLLSSDERHTLRGFISRQLFIPGGRYLYYAGRTAKYYNNCFLLRCEDDTREEWSGVTWRAMSCLMTGGGIGIDYSRLRASGASLRRTGGIASGPIPLMYAINEIGRNVMQGGSRRSAIYASLNWQHPDIPQFLTSKNWDEQRVGGSTNGSLKQENFNHPAPLDMTNISLNYDDKWGFDPKNETFLTNCRQAMMTGEPGFSFNFGDKSNETLRNALN